MPIFELNGNSCLRGANAYINLVDTYGLDNDDFNTEELEEAVADIQDTLGADNYEDQLPQPEVSTFKIFTYELHQIEVKKQ